MELIYNGVDISASVEVLSANLIDSAGGKFDSVELEFDDTAGNWSRWKPAIGDTVQVIQDGFNSGVCYVDELGMRRGVFRVAALSGPIEAKKPRSRSWERVRLSEMIQDCADRYGFKVALYGVDDPLYAWVDQNGTPDFEFLSQRCNLEGAHLKIHDNTILVWSESMLDAQEAKLSISAKDFCETPNYRHRGDLYRTVTVSCDGVSGSFTAPIDDGIDLSVTGIYVSNVAEAQRFAAGIARERNTQGETLEGTIPLNLSIAGGSLITITGFGTGDGKYVVDEVEHRLQDKLSNLILHKRLRGY